MHSLNVLVILYLFCVIGVLSQVGFHEQDAPPEEDEDEEGECFTPRDSCCDDAEAGNRTLFDVEQYPYPATDYAKRQFRLQRGLLKDGLSIVDLYNIEKGQQWIPNPILMEDTSPFLHRSICDNTWSETYRKKILGGIEQILYFYASHQDLLFRDVKVAVGLSFLKDVDDKHGRLFQAVHPILDWISSICKQVAARTREFCFNVTKNFRQRAGKRWKPASLINAIKPDLEKLGKEKEYRWAKLDGQCQLAIVTRCEVPYFCEKTLYDPIPGSKFFLSHQIQQRILTEQFDCPDANRLLSEEVNDQLCAKAYQEANLVSQMGYPHILREIFLQYITICGHLRYPNFFREEWIASILSWQSRSEYGCFSHEKEYKTRFWTSDQPINRRSTKQERMKGFIPDENCLPDFTTAALSALAVSWNYMEENCK